MPQQSSRWHIMAHTAITFAADDQQGPRGGSKSFVEGMAMIMASHALNDSTDLDLQAMLSPDAFMGKNGYPLLLQTGETADGVHPLVDRQHPHDLFMGLTATVTHRFDGDMSGFVRVGWPGENGFGPQAFMHRPSGENFPTAPITHHWFDAGHITMGVVAAGLTQGPVQIEVSQFTGREPDEHRFNLERPHLDSTAMRLTWRITPDLSAQGSWARVVSPEELEPDINLIQKSASLAYTRNFVTGRLDSTLAFGRKAQEHRNVKPSDAWLFENSFHFKGPWIGLARYERVYNDELVPGHAWWVAKTEIGVIRTFQIGHGATLGLGVVRQFNHVPKPLKPAYGDHPNGTVGFIQLKTHWMPMSGMKM
ncbi:hypothetical protein [Asticcacaulis sp. EMRT-3]|uniref:hypothetical protein n=1 Tax=Asticcacaulis sp. EMRT-3 TaxID=3040349 RepID=UPI0024AEFE79|nr:hypothetical protein [Asticcacaulis sp. EMRT-3]MDI7774268.1 hypothetical protein [Asticcacaulis sp. EMRT-3]